MDCTSARPPWWIVLVLVAITAAVGDEQKAVYTVTSQGDWHGFGSQLAADGERLLVGDATQDCKPRCTGVLRVLQVTARGLVEEARLETGEAASPRDVALRGDTLVVRLWSGGLQIYTHKGSSWRRTQRITLDDCQNEPRSWRLELSSGLLLVDEGGLGCVYARRAGRWERAGTWPAVPGVALHLSRNRVIRIGGDQIQTWVLENRAWRLVDQTEIAGADFLDSAGSERWLVALDLHARNLVVIDLDDLRRATTLSLIGAEALPNGLAISDATLIAVGSHDQTWRYVGERWERAGTLAGERFTRYTHPAAGDHVVWIGDPNSFSNDPGRVFGYRLR